MILLLYVDDLFLDGEYNPIIECKKKLDVEFEMKELGLMHYFLGLEVWQYPDEIFPNQGKYTVEILKIFGRLDSALLLVKPKLIKNPSILPYHSLGALFNPYNAFLSLHT